MRTEAAAAAAELERLRETYRSRDAAMPADDWRGNIYHPRHPLGRLFVRHHADVLVDALNALDLELSRLRVLDVGCGTGHWLRLLLELGADPARLVGVDLSERRLEQARRLNPGIRCQLVDSPELPFQPAVFDLVLQVVVFSSVLDAALRRQMAAEMARVLAPAGYLLWIDRRRPQPGRLAGFERQEVLDLFPDFTLRYARPVQPLYYRWLRGRLPRLAEAVYSLTSAACESWLLVLQKQAT